MRGLFKLESARFWAGGLIAVGVLVIIIGFIMQRTGFGRVYPVPPWEHEILILMLGLGITFIIIGITAKKICTCISEMMQAYDEELHRKLNEKKSERNSKDSTSETH